MKPILAILLIFYLACANAAELTAFVVDTHGSFSQAIDRVKQAVQDHNFRVVREADLSVKGVKVHAIWFCNFALLNTAIQTQKEVGYLLPFRVTVVEHDHQVSISAQNPDLSLTPASSQLGVLCQHMTAAYKAILEEVSL